MLIIQNNDGLANADSYVSVSELQDYADKRGIVLTCDATALLVKAMDYIESKQYKSEPTNINQSTAFPRLGVGVPRAIKQAQMALAVIAEATDLMPNIIPTEQVVRREKVDVVEVEYQTNSTKDGLPVFSQIDALLAPYLLKGANGLGMNIRVNRG